MDAKLNCCDKKEPPSTNNKHETNSRSHGARGCPYCFMVYAGLVVLSVSALSECTNLMYGQLDHLGEPPHVKQSWAGPLPGKVFQSLDIS